MTQEKPISSKIAPVKMKARLPRGFQDRFAEDVRVRRHMLGVLSTVYERYGFDPLETPALEYLESLGKFLPDVDRPEGGVFALRDDDDVWLALRYDLTAPLARLYAQFNQELTRPWRRYQYGCVYRNEKPGPGRFREFYQFDADIMGTSAITADAELVMMLSDALEALGVARGDYCIKINNRKLLDAVLEKIGLSGDENPQKRDTVLRAIDKLDRLGVKGVRLLLGTGRKDESGDFTDGAGLTEDYIQVILGFVEAGKDTTTQTVNALERLIGDTVIGAEGLKELRDLMALVEAAGYGHDQICLDPSVVRGLGYYTGPVFEAELTFEVPNEKGIPVRFGSVAGGGRYDGMVARFLGQTVPATGVSIGVDRLLSALQAKNLLKDTGAGDGPVLVTVMDKDQVTLYQAMTARLRRAGIRAEMYTGEAGLKAQMKYADKRCCPIAIIQGSQEREEGIVLLKNLALGHQLSLQTQTNEEWRTNQEAQTSVPVEKLVEAVQLMLARLKEGESQGEKSWG